MRQAMTHKQPVTTPAMEICSCLHVRYQVLLSLQIHCTLEIYATSKSSALDHKCSYLLERTTEIKQTVIHKKQALFRV